jgi:hypothetical protein
MAGERAHWCLAGAKPYPAAEAAAFEVIVHVWNFRRYLQVRTIAILDA